MSKNVEMKKKSLLKSDKISLKISKKTFTEIIY